MNDPDFDHSVFLTLKSELGVEDTMEVLRTFLDDTRAKIERMSRDEMDRVSLQREAHSIKSSAATFGFRELARRARELEAAAPLVSITSLHEAVRALSRMFEATCAFAQTLSSSSETEIAS